jgi:glycosyltransferase involved in cell wall biosynthesis
MVSILIPDYNEPRLDEVKQAIELLPFQVQVVITSNTEGEGKGLALREALKEAIGDYVVFLDGDMDIHPRMILRLLPYLDDYDIVVGTKRLKALNPRRRILTFLSRIYIRVLFGLSIDTQTGIKVFKRSILPTWETDGYAFDIEILAKARQKHVSMVEVPIDAKVESHMSWKSIRRTLMETIRIWFKLNLEKFNTWKREFVYATCYTPRDNEDGNEW